MSKDRREQPVLQQAHVEARDGIVARHERGPDLELVPTARDDTSRTSRAARAELASCSSVRRRTTRGCARAVRRPTARSSRGRRGCSRGSASRRAGTRRRESTRGSRRRVRQRAAERYATASARASSRRSRHAHARRAMVAVGDVERAERIERGCENAAICSRAERATPCARCRSAPSTLNSGARVRRPCARSSRSASFGAIREQHGPRLRVQRGDVAHAIVLLVGPRELVAADAVRSYARTEPTNATPVCVRPAMTHAVDVVRRLARRERARRSSTSAREVRARLARTPRRSTATCRPASRSRGARCAGSECGRPAASARASSVLTTS